MEITQYSLKYRPRKWSEIFGQDKTVSALKERLKSGKIPSSILIRGKYGCGKTTIAELFSACLVSDTLDDDMNPNWNCHSCQSILNGSFNRDVMRLDGSTLSGKDDVIAVCQNLNISPLYDKRKVLIIEEADQISSAGKLSLLKILEGLKPFVTVILLSMESNGISDAIKSRCQTYDIKPLSKESIMFNLKSIMEKENLWNDESIPNEFRLQGLSAIASLSDGSMRNAVQCLEQCVTNGAFTVNQIDELFETFSEEKMYNILPALLNKSKDEVIWHTILGLKSGEETSHFYNYITMILSESMIAYQTGCVYNDRDMQKLMSFGKNPNCKKLFQCFNLNPIFNKAYIRNTDILTALSQYYDDTVETNILREDIVLNTPTSETQVNNSKVNTETPKVRQRVKSTPSTTNNISNLNIKF